MPKIYDITIVGGGSVGLFWLLANCSGWLIAKHERESDWFSLL